MKTIFFIILVLILAGGGYWLYTNNMAQAPTETTGEHSGETSEVTVRGTIEAIDAEAITYDGPLKLTVRTTAGTSAIAIPSMGLNLCAAHPNMVDPFTLVVGDTVEVHGHLSEDGSVVPCASEDHYVRKEYARSSLSPAY